MPGEIAQDELIADPIKAFEVTVFNTMMDSILTTIKERFEGLDEVVNLFSFLYLTKLMELDKRQLVESCNNLFSKYSCDLDAYLLTTKMLSLKRLLSDKNIPKTSRPIDVVDFIVKNDLQEVFPNVITTYFLLLTIPVSIASCERSFSKLKLIKNYIRSTMSQMRLTGLSLLSIEQEIARSLSLNNIIDQFASVKARKLL
jgi:hypothetical protein